MTMATEKTREWAWLPKNVLDQVLDKFLPLSYYIGFAAVCKPWRDVALDQKRWRIQTCCKQLPLLTIPTKDNSQLSRARFIQHHGQETPQLPTKRSIQSKVLRVFTRLGHVCGGRYSYTCL
ncbi:Uncharacterized protein TCM_015223 [Theobroma cacao]|uniref:F-box domain-containing protein n=1 Tax=Theobroma cacao TaxID=3641 RepID=A0A061G1L5_THECC|nr:Uncharacterized protein TCM_015223 [Theobroma cacao]